MKRLGAALFTFASSACGQGHPTAAPALPMNGSWPPPATAPVLDTTPPCRWSGSHLVGEMLDPDGVAVAKLDLRGGTFDVTSNRETTIARGARSAIHVDGVLRTRGLTVWPARRLDLVERHAWIDSSTSIELVTIAGGGVRLALGDDLPGERSFACDALSLTPGRSRPARPAGAGVRWVTYSVKEVPVFDDQGKTIALWSSLPTQDFTIEMSEASGPRRRVRTRRGPVEWDAWIPTDSAEDHFAIPMGDANRAGGHGTRLGASATMQRPPPPRPAKLARASELRVGESPLSARVIGVQLDADLAISIIDQREGFAAIIVDDRAIVSRRGHLWVPEDDVTPP